MRQRRWGNDMFGMTATEFVVMNNTDRDALREPLEAVEGARGELRAHRRLRQHREREAVRRGERRRQVGAGGQGAQGWKS